MAKDRGTFEELKQDAAKHWMSVGTVKAVQHTKIMEATKRPWTCPTCGGKHASGSVCSRCRSARVLEWTNGEYVG